MAISASFAENAVEKVRPLLNILLIVNCLFFFAEFIPNFFGTD